MQLFRPLLSVLFATALFGASASNVRADDDVEKPAGSSSKSETTNSKKMEFSGNEESKSVSESSAGQSFEPGFIFGIKKVFNGIVPSFAGSNLSTAGAPPLDQPANFGGSPNSVTAQQFKKSLALDPDQTKNAINKGMAASMPLLLTYLKRNYPGELVDVQLRSAGASYVYEVRYLSNVVFLRTVYLDAITLQQK